MLFSRQNLDASVLLFREQISLAPGLPFKKLSTIDRLFSYIFFEKEIGSIKALANKQLVHGHFLIPKAKEKFKSRGCDIPLEMLKTIIFNSLAPLFNEIEPSSAGFNFCNENSKGFYWLKCNFDHNNHQSKSSDANSGYLHLMQTGSFTKVLSLAGYREICPTFDIHTATLYCDLFNYSMGIKKENLPRFGFLEKALDINESAYASIFKSTHIQNELYSLITSKLTTLLDDRTTSHIDSSSSIYEDYLELVIDTLGAQEFSYLIEEAISDSLWEIKRKFCLLGNNSFSTSTIWDTITMNIIIKLTIPERVCYIESINLNSSKTEFIKTVIINSIEEASRSYYSNY
ncbi:hypothetical protein H5079_10700 [Pseudoalteromonas sp. SG44-5]|uniref:hypothetical protein n=1 Tax=Pseudoalteromonas sp. SG44-5 TaxID=2760960 RepID=UPI0015FE6E33|nr:hypothetical protein [Pseudoalteromonas sp. SG44-5]MBB1406085.1 hypothetical protein [Pseudoalteromonas sp. SG44-5]